MELWVLLKAGATLHAGPELVSAPAQGPIPMRLVAESADRVVLETPPSAPSCYPLPYAGPVAAQVWVAPDQIEAVLSAAVERRFPDGSALRLDPGLQVTGGTVRVGELRIPVEAAGRSYAIDRHTPAEPADRPVLWAPTTARLGTLERPLDPAASARWYAPFARVEVRGDRAYLTEEAPCAQLVWSAPWPPEPEDPQTGLNAELPSGISGLIGSRGEPTARIAKGTPLYWRDGSPAGQARADILVPPERVNEDGACLSVGPGGSELWVCARPEDIRSNTIGTGSSPW